LFECLLPLDAMFIAYYFGAKSSKGWRTRRDGEGEGIDLECLNLKLKPPRNPKHIHVARIRGLRTCPAQKELTY
ncbi:hypothetical protein KEJ36_02665, partial [Candidatus Bathyarchaeota archaeon]|nr:hypothetical protein [Candidatus Bathyarchaeota archaeon]